MKKELCNKCGGWGFDLEKNGRLTYCSLRDEISDISVRDIYTCSLCCGKGDLDWIEKIVGVKRNDKLIRDRRMKKFDYLVRHKQEFLKHLKETKKC